MTRIEAVIFDLDGTLVDSVADLHVATNLMLRDAGLAPLSEVETRGFVGNGVGALTRRALAHRGSADDPAPHAARLIEHYAAAPAARTRPYPGVREMLAGLSLPIGICTNKPEAQTRQVLRALELEDMFDVVVGGDTLPVLKPDPAPLRHAMAALGAPGKGTLFVGDSEVDEATAKTVDVSFALFSGGYRKRPVAEFSADLAFDDFASLTEWISARL
ncbi:MAG: HAD-IA family hydrolase [Pseudomonadota bacterium]